MTTKGKVQKGIEARFYRPTPQGLLAVEIADTIDNQQKHIESLEEQVKELLDSRRADIVRHAYWKYFALAIIMHDHPEAGEPKSQEAIRALFNHVVKEGSILQLFELADKLPKHPENDEEALQIVDILEGNAPTPKRPTPEEVYAQMLLEREAEAEATDTATSPTPTTLEEAVKNGKYYILDTETTGLDNYSEIVQIAVIDDKGNVIINELVKPVSAIPTEATRIHGITNDMVKDAPTFPEVYNRLLSLIDPNTPVIIYNADYDLRLIKQSMAVYGKTPRADLNPVFCAMLPFAEIYGEWNDYRQNYKWQKLTTACQYYNLPIKDAHNALGDCIMTYALINAMYPTKAGE